MTAELKSGAVGAALLPEPFASGAEQAQGVVPLTDLNQGATTAFPIAGYVVTKKWAARYPRTLAAFYAAIEEGQQLADTNRSDVEEAMMDIPAPFGVSRQTAAVLALDSYPFSPGPVGTVDKIRLERVVNVMEQFIGFPSQHRRHDHAPRLSRERARGVSERGVLPNLLGRAPRSWNSGLGRAGRVRRA
jgi:NitT/TauT family transport system substrate-binding protein